MSVTPAAMNTASASQRSHSPLRGTSWKKRHSTTTGTAAMRAYVRMFGSDSGRAGIGRVGTGLLLMSAMQRKIILFDRAQKALGGLLTADIQAPQAGFVAHL
jgi:hypothetical protein